eukprot:tig00020685_g12975.t1
MPDSTVVIGDLLFFRIPIYRGDTATDERFRGFFIVSVGDNFAPVISATFPEIVAVCRRARIVAFPISGTGRRPLTYYWSCVDEATCSSLAERSVTVNTTHNDTLIVPDDVPHTRDYRLSVYARNYLGAKSNTVQVKLYKSGLFVRH